MKQAKTLLFNSIFTLFIFLIVNSTAVSQVDRIEDFLRAGQADAEILTEAYLKPLPNGLGGSLNTGWFNSASTHRPLGFDLQIRGALAFIPNSDRNFDISDLALNRTELAEGESPITPTIGGDNSIGPEVVVRDNGDEVARFNMPQGSGLQFVPSPMIQASVGLIKQTDLIVRYLPKVEIPEYGNFQMEGFGLKHSLSQWLPGGKLFPVDIAIMAGYNRINLNSNLNLDPPQPDPTTDYDNQRVETSFDTFTAKLIVGKDLPFISLYGSVGYETSTMNLDVLGNYPVQVNTTVEGVTVQQTETITDPFSYSKDGINKYSFTGGLKFKLLFFHIFGEYTLAEYPVANAGIGFSFR